MKVKKILLINVLLFLSLNLFPINLTIRIVSENLTRKSPPVFDLLSCNTVDCRNGVQVFLKDNQIIKTNKKIIVKNLKPGKYLLILHKTPESIYYFENNSYFLSLEEGKNEVIDIREIKGGTAIIKLYDKKNKPFIAEKAKFINLWFKRAKNKPLFYRFDKIKKNEIIINGIPEGIYDLHFLCDGFGVKIGKEFIVKKDSRTNLSLIFDSKSKTGVKGKIICGDILKRDETISIVELIKTDKNDGVSVKYGITQVDKDGNYSIKDVEPGEYSLSIEIKSISPLKGPVSLIIGRYKIKIKKNKLKRYTNIFTKEELKALGLL